MINHTFKLLAILTGLCLQNIVLAADVVPAEIELPGTQPNEVSNLESPDRCDNCHAGYNTADPEAEPATGWRGSAMGNASRDPVFWATMAVAEQDFDGSGDLCIRCHSTSGWYGGHSTPTDGSGIPAGDDNGVDCDTCHTMTNPDNSDPILQGIMHAPYIANCSDDPITPNGSCSDSGEGYFGSGMLSLWAGSDKLGPYVDADARHQFQQSRFHRDVDFCGSCHDVSNSAVGDLAPGNGAQVGAPHVISSQDFHGGVPNLGGPVEEKAAFNNPPYAYGVVERTFSEYKASAFPTTRVSAFDSLPADLKTPGGSIEVTYQASLVAGQGGDYADGTPRFFSCQSCHMRPTTSAGANKNGVQVRTDLPRHDLTGGNYWIGDIIKYQDSRNHLRLGGGLSATQIDAIDRGSVRAGNHLTQAATLQVNGNNLRVTNLTGHKLISGYPEGRRMWLNVKWYDSNNELLREDGAYGPIGVSVANPAGGPDVEVASIVDLNGTNTRIYEAHYAITQDWAERLLAVGKPASMPLSFDRASGAVTMTLGELAAQPAGSHHDTFHFVLNNYVSMDNRIPPYGMRYDTAVQRNTLPVPASQYGNPGAAGSYDYFDNVALNPPVGASRASIDLLYQGTSWEYIQFLYLANNGQNAFLAQEGVNMLEAWLNTGMAQPYVMASASWTAPPPLPAISGIWSADFSEGDEISLFVFGSNFTMDGSTTVAINGVTQYLVAPVSTEMLIVRTTVTPDLYGPVSVSTSLGTAQSTSEFGVPLSGLQITGIWPSEVTAGDNVSVMIFGNDFIFDGVPLVYFNGIQQYLVAVVSPQMLIVRLQATPDLSGTVEVVTTSGSVTSNDSFLVRD